MHAASQQLGNTSGYTRFAGSRHTSHWNPLAAELLKGLTHARKYINPKFFYDERGSELFHRITTLPEYYPTRTENQILEVNSTAIADAMGPDAVLIEPGAGNCEKVRFLLDSVRPSVYLPQDISEDFLLKTVAELKHYYPWLTIEPLLGDFADCIALPDDLPEQRKIVFYPGSTIGNFEPAQAVNFLRDMRELIGEDGGLVIGVDLQKDPAILNAAYNDSAGVTAEFNRNILEHANRILRTDIDSSAFTHRAFYNEVKHRIEMHLVSTREQKVDCGDVPLHFSKGETIHTECSYKYTPESFAALAQQAGFELKQTWMDREQLFSVNYLV